MKKRCLKPLFLMSVLFSLTIALTGCSGDKAKESPSEITIGLAQDIEDSLDPHKAVAAGTKEILFNLFEGLVKPDADGNLIDAVASAHEVSEDGRTYTFTLRDGVKFHDGSPVTVDDVKYSIDRCADTGDGDPLVSAFSNIESVTILDDQTVEVKLKEADTEFLAYMTTAIIPKSNDAPDVNPIGTGPYKYVSRSPQENMILEKFDEYWGTPANIDKITLKIIADPDSIAMNLNGGAIDMFMRITTGQMNELSDDFELYEGTMNLVQALYLNNASEPFTDVRVRQALCYAIDKQAVIDLAFDGYGIPLGTSMFPSFAKYYDDTLTDYYTQDIEKAKALLAEAGYPDGFEMTITVPSNYTPHVNAATVIAEQLRDVGIHATLNLLDWSTWLSEVYSKRNFQTTVTGVTSDNMTARKLLERFGTTTGNNFTNYSNSEYDAVLALALSESDDAAQTELYKKLEINLTENAANVYIQDLADLIAVRNGLGGYVLYPLYVMDVSTLFWEN